MNGVCVLRMVAPSAPREATASVPMMVPAPSRFSTTIAGWFARWIAPPNYPFGGRHYFRQRRCNLAATARWPCSRSTEWTAVGWSERSCGFASQQPAPMRLGKTTTSVRNLGEELPSYFPSGASVRQLTNADYRTIARCACTCRRWQSTRLCFSCPAKGSPSARIQQRVGEALPMSSLDAPTMALK
jgi:hypothetical protein